MVVGVIPKETCYTIVLPRTSAILHAHHRRDAEGATGVARSGLFVRRYALGSPPSAVEGARCSRTGPVHVGSIGHFHDTPMRAIVLALSTMMFNALRWLDADYLSSPKGDQLDHCQTSELQRSAMHITDESACLCYVVRCSHHRVQALVLVAPFANQVHGREPRSWQQACTRAATYHGVFVLSFLRVPTCVLMVMQ